MQRSWLFLCLFSLCLGLAGCLPEVSSEQVTVAVTRVKPTEAATAVSIQPSQEPTPTPTNTQLPSPTATPTSTPQPSQTPVPPTATPIPTAIPTKPWLIKLSYPGGDGGTNYDKYFGRGMPDLILFNDGQMLIRDRNDISKSWFENEWFVEIFLSQAEIQELFAQIESAGFFEKIQVRSNNDADWLYNFDETTEFSDGVGGPLLCIALGDETNCIQMYAPYIPYLVPEIANTLSLVQGFHPADKDYTLYAPGTLILWIEPMRDTIRTDEVSQTWPENLPTVSQLLVEYPSGIVLLHGDEAMPFFTLFDSQIDDGIFSDDGMEYYMISRPLLPSEAPDRFRPPNVFQ
ncbi:MAG: hypothetical protein IT327_05635 [Anaerolineae bacterium]|nr:hypothetical protein [Anaerolineae bacterium]